MKSQKHPIRQKRIIIFAIILFFSLPCIVLAQNKNASDSLSPNHKPDSLCLMGSFSVGLYAPKLDHDYIQDFGYWGLGYKFGVLWSNRITQFQFHNETEDVIDQFDEFRNDYALLYGVTFQNDVIRYELMAGVSIFNYTKRGTQLTLLNSPDTLSSSYQKLSGTIPGLAGSVGFYLFPIKYWGIFGLSLYGSFNKLQSYFVLDWSLVELQFPFSIR